MLWASNCVIAMLVLHRNLLPTSGHWRYSGFLDCVVISHLDNTKYHRMKTAVSDELMKFASSTTYVFEIKFSLCFILSHVNYPYHSIIHF